MGSVLHYRGNAIPLSASCLSEIQFSPHRKTFKRLLINTPKERIISKYTTPVASVIINKRRFSLHIYIYMMNIYIYQGNICVREADLRALSTARMLHLSLGHLDSRHMIFVVCKQ